MGVNTWTLGNWEKGYTKPALRFWPKIIDFLGYDPSSTTDLVGGSWG